MRAIFLNSEDILRIDESIRLRTYGPRTIPVANIPKSPGSLIFLHIQEADIPTNKIKAMLNNIFFLRFPIRTKKLTTLRIIRRSHQLIYMTEMILFNCYRCNMWINTFIPIKESFHIYSISDFKFFNCFVYISIFSAKVCSDCECICLISV